MLPLRLLTLASILLLPSCALLGGKEIKDFDNRSVVYGWLDIKDVDANRLHQVSFFQSRPKTKEPYYQVGVEKFKGGYLFYHYGFPNGAFKLDQASGQNCLLFLCSNTIHTYSFGKQGDDVGTVVINKPGVYYVGAHAFRDVKTGWFEAGRFEVVKAKAPPSQREMLEFLALQDVPKEFPVIAARLKKAMQ